MISLTDASTRIGDAVVYEVSNGPRFSDRTFDMGVVTGVNESFVFVRYGGDSHSKATRPEDLDWLRS